RSDPEPGPTEVLVRMHAASLNFRDLAIVRGKYIGGPVTRNTIPLSDGAGVVEAIGDAVTDFAVGDRVTATFSQGGPFRTLGSPLDGTLAEYGVFDQGGLLEIPDGLGFEQAATLPCAGVTAWDALTEGKRIRSGDTVLTLGTGGVSIMALQLAKAAGARVIITSSSNEKLETARALGADVTVNYRENPDWERVVLEATAGAGADHVIDLGGVGTLPHSYQCVAEGGEIKLIGVMTRPEGDLSPYPLMFKGATLRGIFVGRSPRGQFAALLRAVAQNGIEPVIDRVFAFDEAAAAYEHLASARHLGKVVIRIG
ncbi:MAG TPA: NAD(P)-dependent alcohol dehydrogenase, partial [Gammaproteobacteria bacterium]|nr:NAD(P)-dependent alcohol dehydrogenase [Gammaproteobacteria bacterium]